MLTREIPRDEWLSFFNNFSRSYHGWSVLIEVMAEDFGAQIEVNQLPLEGIAADLKSAGKDIISIIVGDDPNDHISHTITGPTHIRIDETDRENSLQIETTSGHTTLLRFCSSLI